MAPLASHAHPPHGRHAVSMPLTTVSLGLLSAMGGVYGYMRYVHAECQPDEHPPCFRQP